MSLLCLIIALLPWPLPSAAIGGSKEPRIVYRTADRMTTAIAYDSEGDTPVELARLSSEQSVVRRITPAGQPGETIWMTEHEAFCPGGTCGMEVEYSEKLGGYVFQTVLRRFTSYVPMVYFVPRRGGAARLLARSVIQSRPAYPERDSLEPSVVGFDSIWSLTVADTGHILVSGIRRGDGVMRTFALKPGASKPVSYLEGAILGKSDNGYFVSLGTQEGRAVENDGEEPADIMKGVLIAVSDPGVTKVVRVGNRRAELHGAAGQLVLFDSPSDPTQKLTSQAKPATFAGCGSDRTRVTGVWSTKRGTLMVAAESRSSSHEQGRWVYKGTARCLYEIQ